MTRASQDLQKVGDVLLEFFKTKRVRDSLGLFMNLGVSGWEKWWQTELAVYLAGADNIAEWDMEHPFDTDRRTAIAQSRMALDIGFRLKRHATDSWYFIELKQHDDYQRCLQRMGKDIEKVLSARKRSFDGLQVRYIACAGLFADQGNSTDEIIEYAETLMEALGAESGGVILEEIGKHHSLIVI